MGLIYFILIFLASPMNNK